MLRKCFVLQLTFRHLSHLLKLAFWQGRVKARSVVLISLYRYNRLLSRIMMFYNSSFKIFPNIYSVQTTNINFIILNYKLFKIEQLKGIEGIVYPELM